MSDNNPNSNGTSKNVNSGESKNAQNTSGQHNNTDSPNVNVNVHK